ncbi:hypothetical protein GGD52_002282 [Agrobacterium tumefaciens]|nr:hypothetical protein [Agrobacterium radiobacter]MBB5587689.1 hypothetical protein [Agrobacterium radiobacter]
MEVKSLPPQFWTMDQKTPVTAALPIEFEVDIN